MTSSSPDEAIHFRGKTLTPESPRPLHIPEPSNIPVLLNQMDPIFNDTATYDKPNSSHERSLERVPFLGLVNASAVKVNGGGDTREGQDPGSFQAGSQQVNGERDKRIDVTLSATTNTFPSNHHSSPSPSTLLSASTSPAVTEPSIVPGEANPSWSTRSSDAAPLIDPPISQIPSQTALPPLPSPLPSPLPPTPQALQAPSSAEAAAPAPAPSPAPAPVPALPVALDSFPPPPAPFPTAPFANIEVDAPDPRSNLSSVSLDGSFWAQSTERTRRVAEEDGVDFQSLLNNLSSSTSTAPSGPIMTAIVSSPANDAVLPQPMSERALPPPMGLPPRPPPQEKPSVHPNYAPSDDIRSYHHFPPQNPSTSAAYANATPQSNYHPNPALPPLVAAPGAAPGMSPGANGLPPPPVATFQQQPHPQPTSMKSQEPSNPQSHKSNRLDRHAARQPQTGEDDTPWGPDVQKKYDEFLHDERVYVTEGLWDRFPQGSRLFVGNLPTERVTKRDLFHVFHKYGKLAQISIKQAYGFVQFLDANACYEALQAEQGGVVRGRKIHLEISKPQRNSRQAPLPTETARSTTSRRSRSPDYGRNSGGGGGGSGRSLRSQGDRYERSYESGRPPFSDFRDEPATRRRDDYRPPRSPSPRSFRARDEYRSRDRTPERYDRRERRRSRSPYTRDRRYRSPSPRARGYESDSDLPFPRRAPRDVPDVQIIVLDDVDGNFIYHIESSFKSRGLKVDVLILNPRISVSTVIRRQLVEGVIGVVKVARSHQFSGKIPLQVFDRSSGVDNARSNDYAELDLNVAAEIIIHAQTTQRASVPNPYPPNPGFSAPQFPPAPPPQPPMPSFSDPGRIAGLISALDGPSLQSLLGALQQPQPPAQPAQAPFAPANASHPVDLASLLSTATRHQNPPQSLTGVPGPPPQPLPAPPFGLQAPKPPMPDPNNLMSILAKGLGGHPPPNQPAVGPHVQNIVNQFAKWKH